MLTRYVYLRLKAEHRDQRDALVALARERLTPLPMVRSFKAGTPADEHAERAWDICFEIRLDDLAAVDDWQTDPIHRDYVDNTLKPRVEVKKAWNFEV